MDEKITLSQIFLLFKLRSMKKIWRPSNVYARATARIKIKFFFQNLLLCKYSSYRNIYSLIINVTRKEIKVGYGSTYLNVYFKIRA